MGGTVSTSDVKKAADASFIIITCTSQKEIHKPTQKMNKTLIMAFCLGWKIISKIFTCILQTRNTNTLPPVSDYQNYIDLSNSYIDLPNIGNAPANSVLRAKVLTNATMINNH